MEKIIKSSSYLLALIAAIYTALFPVSAIAQKALPKTDSQCTEENDREAHTKTSNNSAPCIDIPPEVIKDSPTLQKWLQKTPNVLEDIRHDPSFTTRWRWGFSFFSRL